MSRPVRITGKIALALCVHVVVFLRPGLGAPLPADPDRTPGSGATNAETLRLDLESSLGIAITGNTELRAIHAGRQIYDLTVMERLRDYFPSLSFSYADSREVARRDTDSRYRKLGVEASLDIYDGGRKGLAYDIARLKGILARNDYRIALNRLIAETLKSYLELIQLKGTIEIHRKTLEQGMAQLTLIRKELELGEATRFNVLEIEAKVKEIELNLKKAVDNFEIARNRFKILLRLDWRRPVEVLGDVENDFSLYGPDGGRSIDECVAIAVRNRKEVESADVEHAVNTKSHRINRLYFFPRFSLGAGYSLSDPDGSSERFIPREKGWNLSLQVTSALWGSSASGSLGLGESENANTRNRSASAQANILDAMDYKRAIVESGIQMDTSKENRRSLRQQVSIEVLSSYMALENAWEMMDIADKQLALYDAQLEIERLKANMGESNRYDLMKKEIERGEAAVARLESRVRYLTNASTLELAMGVDIGFLKLSKYRGTINVQDP